MLIEKNVGSIEKLAKKLEKNPKFLQLVGFEDEFDMDQIARCLSAVEVKVSRMPPNSNLISGIFCVNMY